MIIKDETDWKNPPIIIIIINIGKATETQMDKLMHKINSLREYCIGEYNG